MPGPQTVVLMLLPLVIAVAVRAYHRQSLLRLLQLRMRWPVLLWAAAAVHLLRFQNPRWLPAWAAYRNGSILIALCWLFGAAWVLVNRRSWTGPARTALAVIFVGFTLNITVILANAGQMPFSAPAARLAGMPESLLRQRFVGHTALDDGHHLRWFSDVIPLPVLHKVVSLGDLVMLAGIAAVLIAAPGPRTRTAAGPPRQ
jgi:hypothetical protein